MTFRSITYHELQITPAMVYRQMGYGGAQPAGDVAEETLEVMRLAAATTRPAFCYTVLRQLPDFRLGRVIAGQLRGAVAYAVFLCTAGDDFAQLQRRLADDILRAFIADALGSVIAECTADCMELALQASIDKLGWRRTNRYSPGYCGWHVAEQQRLFALFGTDNPWATTGTNMEREHNIVNSLYLSPEELERKNIERFERYKQVEAEECLWEEYLMDDAEICVVSYGITARISKNAIAEARKEGIKVGMIRPITLWPFPNKPLAEAADKVDSFLSVELNMGQMVEDIKLAIDCKKPVDFCGRVGGMIPTPDEVLDHIRALAEGGR